MIARLVGRTLWRSPRRLAIGLIGIAVPVAVFAATSFFVDTSSRTMTTHAVAPVQVDMQVIARRPSVDMAAVAAGVANVAGVRTVEPFAMADLPVALAGAAPRPVRVFAVRRDYLRDHPWVNVTGGDLAAGVLIADPLASPQTVIGSPVQLSLPGSAQPVTLSVGGTVDLRKADVWFAALSGDSQGDVHFVPDSMVVDYSTFERLVLPGLRAAAPDSAQAAGASGTAVAAVPGNLSLQDHVGIDHGILAADPSVALRRSTGLRRTLERTSPGQIMALDNLGDVLGSARADALNAKVLFLFLGIPGVLVAAGLALATNAALAAARRREVALLRLRGATAAQVRRLATGSALAVGAVGSALGLGLAAVAVTVLLGNSVWQGAAAAGVVSSSVLALVVGMIVTGLSLRANARDAAGTSVAAERSQLEPTSVPAWRRRRLDLAAIGVCVAVLAVNAWSGGFRRTNVEGQTLALSFYLLLAPLALWAGVTLLGVRAAAVLLARSSRPERSRPLGSWPASALRWIGRRPRRTMATVITGALAVAFGANLVAFVNTYDVAKKAEVAYSVGSDLRITPAQTTPAPVPPLRSPDIAASTAVRVVSTGVGADTRSGLAIDPASFAAAVPRGPEGAGPRTAALGRLGADPLGVLVSKTFGKDFNVLVGDPLAVSFPDPSGRPRLVTLHTVGLFTTAAPAVPGADLMFNVAALTQLASPAPGSAAVAAPAVRPPDFYLARVATGASVDSVAARLRTAGSPQAAWSVLTFRDALVKEQNTLATLNLGGLGRIETAGTLVIAALGTAVLAAFLLLERRREYAVLGAIGASTAQLVVPPALEGGLTIAASLALGLPVGVAMTAMSTRVLNPLFSLSPPLVRVPWGQLAALVALVVGATVATLAAGLAAIGRLRVVTVLRDT